MISRASAGRPAAAPPRRPRAPASAWSRLRSTTAYPLDVQSKVAPVIVNGKEIELSNKRTRLYDKHMGRQ